MAETELPSYVLQIAYGLVFLLLVGVTGGIGYLTLADWRDRRRRSREEKASKPPRSPDKRRTRK